MTSGRRRGLLAAAAVGVLLLALSWSPRPIPGSVPAGALPSAAPSTSALPAPQPTAGANAGPSAAPGLPPFASQPVELGTPAPNAPDPVPDPEVAADRQAGVLDDVVPSVGTGTFTTVPGATTAPRPGSFRTVRVEVEGGLSVLPEAFAQFVMATLNDPRGWSHDGVPFVRTDGAADIVVVLASPQTSEQLCRPLVTLGEVSCRTGTRAVITYYRWVAGQPDYGSDRTGYRQYVINHEVGHVLGQVHVTCPGPGMPAPVMQQQTLGLQGCAPNPWPYP